MAVTMAQIALLLGGGCGGSTETDDSRPGDAAAGGQGGSAGAGGAAHAGSGATSQDASAEPDSPSCECPPMAALIAVRGTKCDCPNVYCGYHDCEKLEVYSASCTSGAWTVVTTWDSPCVDAGS
jgi:hypothetical protein